jgi:hypothetical protein
MKTLLIPAVLAAGIAVTPLAQAAPTPEPSGPCNTVPTTPQSVQACQACLKPMYPPANQPPITPHQQAMTEWNCGMPGAPNPAEVPLDSNGQ